jgi:putative membrane protein
MHARLIALLHGGVANGVWPREPAVVIPLVLLAALYVAGARRLWSFQRGRGVRIWEVASFGAGWAVLALALVSPLHSASEQSFAAHMMQHELLMVVAAPLLVLGRPMIVMLWALPSHTRRLIGIASTTPAWRRAWHVLSRPLDAWLIHGVVIWSWHLPALFQATLHSDVVHGLQHLSFLGSALLFWWALVQPRRQASLGLSIIYLFTTAVHTAVLGALMTFARTPWYPEYAATASLWGATAMEDQQLAGLIMWIPASLAYLIAALLIVRRWLRESEWRVARSERAVLTL